MRPSSSRSSRRSFSAFGHNWIRVVAVLVLSMSVVAGSFPVDASAVATKSAAASNAGAGSVPGIAGWFGFGQDTGDDDEPVPVDENPNDRVAGWDICQREVEMYVGESYTLVPTPIDSRGDTVHGVVPVWTTAHPDIVGVTADGELGAYAPGRTTASIRAGFSELTLNVVVHEGRRPDLTGDEWDAQHGLDCGEPDVPPDTEKVLTPGGYVDGNSEDYGTGGSYPPISADVRKYFNSVAGPRFDPVESVVDGGATKTRKNLGSDNYSFQVPVLSLPGRGIGAGLALSYNSRLWTKDLNVTPNSIKWNYNKGWPAVGWTIGYGRIVENYNGSNDRLLIQGDGTRIILKRVSTSPERYESQDGTFIALEPEPPPLDHVNRLRYPDGTLVTYERNPDTNNKMLPVSIRTTNGASILIAYKAYNSSTFKFRWAINTITDTCGRVIKFHYDDPTTDVLTRITAPNQTTGADHTLIEIGYDDLQMVTNFSSSLDVQGRPAQQGGVRWFSVVKAIRYPDTGQGWVFEFPALGATNYGMAKAISVRRSMTGVGAGQYGTEIARTDFVFNDTGTLSDAPKYTSRTETWTTSDQSGTVTNQSGTYSYSSTPGNGIIRTDTITSPDGSKVVTTTSDDSTLPAYGKPTKIEWQTAGGATLRRMTYMYGDVHEGSGGLQPELIESLDKTWNESGSTLQMSARVTYDYYSLYGRLKTVTEYDADETTARRITSYEYKDGAGYTVDPNSAHILDRVTKIEVKTGGGTVKARTEYLYDSYTLGGGMEGYGIPEPLNAGHGDFPPNQGTNFDSTKLNRGNVTRVREWHDPATAGAYYDRILKYDIFGNVVSADVSCCRKKVYNFLKVSQPDDTRYSQPESVTDGSGTVTLKTTYLYDFHTGLVKTMTDPAGDQTTYVYDAALRLDKVTYPALSGQTSEVDIVIDDANRTYAETVTYTTSGMSTNLITSKSWLDGAGRVVRSGTGSGMLPSVFDAVTTKYDNMGRTLQTTNPYAGSSTATTVGTVYWTENVYDALSRVDIVKLPDDTVPNPSRVEYTYDGSKAVTVSDPAGRKRLMEYDALGRMTKVVEHNTSGTFSASDANWTTTYGYDTLDNLTSVTQSTSTGSQARTFGFDALSRLLTSTTPEGGSETYTYFDHAGVKKMTNAGLGVETHYVYDELNRPKTIWYTGLGGDDDPGPNGNPALPLTVADTANVVITYYTSGDGKGQIDTITNGGGFEDFEYDAIGRVSQRKWTVTGGTLRTTTYSYNAADQITAMNYPAPSSKQLAYSYDSRGRVSGLDKTNATTLQYLSAVMYSSASQVTSLKIGPSANNLTETFAYSADRLQLTSQTVTKGSTLMSLTYDYTSAAGELGATLPANRNNGQLLGISGTLNGASAAQTFTYDTLGRLVTATGQGSAGTDTVGAYAPSTAVWNLRNSNSGGAADLSFGYGAGGSGFLPISGDWDGDGDDTIGLYDPATGTFYLRNSNSAGPADVPPFTFGAGGGIPVAGDWNGDGIDTIGFYTSSNQTFYLRNSNTAGPADVTPFSFGASNTWKPITGDWDGDGDDTIGSFDPSNNGYFLRNTNSPGGADISFTFGTGGGTPLAGDWNGDGVDTIGYRTSGGTFNLRNSNTPGGADITPFTFSSSSDIPIMGDWDGLGTGGASWQRRYGYDRWANRTSVHDATTGGNQIQSVGIVGGTSTPTNRITTVTEGVQNFDYDYDAAGNVTGDGVHTYKYDAANRLAEVDGGTTATYSYDAANRRVKTVALGVTTYTVWEGMHPIMEIDSTGALVEDYVYSGARLLATERGGVAYFHHQDRLSTRLLTNSAGAVVGTSSHLPYGEDGLQTGVESRHKFTTYNRDGESGLDYAVNRQYESGNGRYLQVDPIRGSTSTPQSLNRYAYVADEPVGRVDPLGLLSKAQCDDIYKLLALEQSVGTRQAAIQSSNTNPWSNHLLANLNSSNVPNTQTKYGELDIDWFADTHVLNYGEAPALYPAAKLIWTGAKVLSGEEIGSYLPYTDPGERNAILARLQLASFADIFDPEFLRRECGAYQTQSVEPPSLALKLLSELLPFYRQQRNVARNYLSGEANNAFRALGYLANYALGISGSSVWSNYTVELENGHIIYAE